MKKRFSGLFGSGGEGASDKAPDQPEAAEEEAILNRARSLSRTASPDNGEWGSQHFRKSSGELLKDLGDDFFTPDFDPVKRLFETLPFEEELSVQHIGWFASQESDKDCARDVVINRLYRQVMTNYTKFVQGMQHVRDFEMDLTSVGILCKNSRRLLQRSHDELVQSVMGIIQRVRRKKRLLQVTALVREASAVFALEAKLRQALQGEGDDVDIEAAVRCYMDMVEGVSHLTNLACIQELRARLPATRKTLLDGLFTSLVASCTIPDSKVAQVTFETAVRGYAMMGEARVLLPKLLGEVYAEQIEAQTVAEIRQHVTESMADQTKVRLSDLCKVLQQDTFPNCFVSVASAILRVLHRFHCAEQFMAASLEDVLRENGPSAVMLRLVRELHRAHADKQSAMRSLLTVTAIPAVTKGAAPIQAILPSPPPTKQDKALPQGEEKEMEKKDVSVMELVATQKAVLWRTVQDVVGVVLSSVTLTPMTVQLEDFLKILHATNMLKAVGEHFGRSPAFGLISSVQFKSREYIDTFHRQNVYYMKQTLENELWRILPLPEGFGLHDIKELTQAKWRSATTAATAQAQAVADDDVTDASDDDEAKNQRAVYAAFCSGQQLFATPEEEQADREARQAAEEAASEEQRRPLTRVPSTEPWRPSSLEDTEAKVDVEAKEEPKRLPIITSNALNTARFVGKYIHIMQTLPALAINAFHGMTELFDYYLYNVFNLFGVNAHRFYNDDFPPHLYPRLRAAMVAMRNRHSQHKFGSSASFSTPGVSPSTTASNMELFQPTFLQTLRNQSNGSFAHVFHHAEAKEEKSGRFSFLSKSKSTLQLAGNDAEGVVSMDKVDVFSPASMYGLIERATATESLLFLLDVLHEMEHKIAMALPKTAQTQVVQFMEYATQVTHQMQVYMYRNFPSLVIAVDPITASVVGCKWNVSDLTSKHNAYVDLIVQAVSQAKQMLMKLGGLPEHVMTKLWEKTLEYLMESILHAYAKVRKCSTEGRALMSLDLNELKNTLAIITGVQHVPMWDTVHEWVKAFYLPAEEDFLRWVQEHPEYSLEQCRSLALTGLGANMKKKDRQVFLERVDETHRGH